MTFEVMGPNLDIGAFWKTLGQRAIGATLVTTMDSTGPNGFLGLSAAHVSATPPTMLVSIDKKTSALKGVLESGAFAINFLPAGTAGLANMFGGKAEKVFEESRWCPFVTGAPTYVDALGVFDCTVENVVEHADISIIIGAVKGVRGTDEKPPLVFFRGKWLNDTAL